MTHHTYLREYFPIPDSHEHLEVDVYYTLGGTNWFDNSTIRRGIWVSFTPVEKSQNAIARRLGDNRGRKHLLQEVTRRSVAAGRAGVERVSRVKPQLVDAAIEQNWSRVAELLS